MRTLIILILTNTLIACIATAPPGPTSEAEKIVEVEQLIRFSLTDRLISDLQKRSREQIVPVLTARELPAEQAERLVAEELENVTAVEQQRLIDALVPIYRRVYTAEEIHQLLSFYQADVARKSIKASQQIAAEGQRFIRLWNEHFGAELLERIEERLSAEAK